MPGKTIVQSLRRGLQILEAIVDAKQGIPLNELAASVGLRTTTAHNLLQTLVVEKYVHNSGRGVYWPGAKIAVLNGKIFENSMIERMEKILKTLSAQYPEMIVTYAEPLDGEIYLRLRISPHLPRIVTRFDNRKMDLYTSASGLCVLAFADQEVKELVLDNYPFYEFGASFWKSMAQLEAFLAAVKQDGYVVSPYKPMRNFPIAMPVADHKGSYASSLGFNFRGVEPSKIALILPKLLKEAGALLGGKQVEEI